MSEIFVQYLATVIATCLILYCIGYFVFKLIRFEAKGSFTNVFLKCFVGCVSFTAICALYFTSLKTIFSGLLICLAYFFYGFRSRSKKNSLQAVPVKNEILVLFLFLIVCTLFYSYRFYSATYNGDILNIPNPDFTFYARISHFLVESGIESATPTLVYPELNSRNPYHYFDLWFCGGISHFSGGNYLQILFLVSYTIGISLVWLGFCCLAENLNRLNAVSITIAFLGTFFMPLPTYFSEAVNKFLNQFLVLTHAPAEYIDYGLWNMNKLYPVYLILIVSILAFLKKEKVIGIALVSTLAFIYSTICIPIVLAVSMYILYDYFIVSKDKKFFASGIIFLALVNAFIFIFYFNYLTDSSGNGLDPFRRLGVEPIYKSIFRPVKIFFDATAQLVILLSPFILLLFLDKLKTIPLKNIPYRIFEILKSNEYVHLAIIFYAAGLATWAILYDVVDANQFFATSSIPLINILCVVLFMGLSKIYVRISALAFGLYFVYYTTIGIFEQRLYSEKYMTQISEAARSTGRIGGFLLSKKDYEEGFGYNIVEVLGDYITLFRPDNFMVNLSITDLPGTPEKLDSDSARLELSKHDFYKFMAQQKLINEFKSVEQSRIDFINKFQIDFLIVSARVELDSAILKRINRKIIDDYSQQAFLVLSKQEGP